MGERETRRSNMVRIITVDMYIFVWGGCDSVDARNPYHQKKEMLLAFFVTKKLSWKNVLVVLYVNNNWM